MFISSMKSIFLSNSLLDMLTFILVDSTTVRENVISPWKMWQRNKVERCLSKYFLSVFKPICSLPASRFAIRVKLKRAISVLKFTLGCLVDYLSPNFNHTVRYFLWDQKLRNFIWIWFYVQCTIYQFISIW